LKNTAKNFRSVVGRTARRHPSSLERLLARRPEGIFVNPFERGKIGPDLFRAACRMGFVEASGPSLSGLPVEALG
jgi:hypothetical protein